MTTQRIPVKENLTEISEQKFNELLAALLAAKLLGFSGPFIHSAPNGDMFRDGFSERAWMIGSKTVLFKQESSGDEEPRYYADKGQLKEYEGRQP